MCQRSVNLVAADVRRIHRFPLALRSTIKQALYSLVYHRNGPLSSRFGSRNTHSRAIRAAWQKSDRNRKNLDGCQYRQRIFIIHPSSFILHKTLHPIRLKTGVATNYGSQFLYYNRVGQGYRTTSIFPLLGGWLVSLSFRHDVGLCLLRSSYCVVRKE